jgi:type IV fimbrial biogenesis protein FimT
MIESDVIRAMQRGMTVIEMMIAVLIVAIVAALGAPSLLSFVVQSRMTGQINDLLADISYARSEAASRGVRIGFCASNNSTTSAPTCSGSTSDWVNGRIVFVDVDGDGQRSTSSGSAEILLKASPALAGNSTLAISWSGSGSAPASFQFRPYGGLATANNQVIGSSTIVTSVTFTLCPNSTGVQGRQIAIAMTGRPVASKVGC